MGQGSWQKIETGDQRESAFHRKDIPCDMQGCEQHAVCSMELRFFCLDHFVSYSYQRLEHSSTLVSGGLATTLESNDSFLGECLLKSANLVSSMKSIDNLNRARLFDICLWASDISAKRSALGAMSTPAVSWRWP
jgi:hypothetical protein